MKYSIEQFERIYIHTHALRNIEIKYENITILKSTSFSSLVVVAIHKVLNLVVYKEGARGRYAINEIQQTRSICH
jgi:hypothetical protein